MNDDTLNVENVHQSVTDWLLLFDGGSVNYKRIAMIANLSKTDFAKLTKVRNHAITFDGQMPSSVASLLQQVGSMANMVASYFKGDINKVQLWFRMWNPMLGGISPRDMIRIGRCERLMNFVVEALDSENIDHHRPLTARD